MVMDVLVVTASLVRPFLVNPVPMSGGEVLGFKFQLLHVLKLLGFQICVHSCLEYLGQDNLLLGDMNSTETCNKTTLSSCQSCLNSLMTQFKEGTKHKDRNMYVVAQRISLEVDNLLWMLDILEDRKASEKFALMWANQQKLESLHRKVWLSTCYLVSCITARLFAGLRNGKILLDKDTRQLLLQTWFQPLVDDYPRLKKLESFDPKKLEENIEVGILELTPELFDPKKLEENIEVDILELAPKATLMAKGTDVRSDIRKGFEGRCRRVVKMLPFYKIFVIGKVKSFKEKTDFWSKTLDL
ncbi:hypothetical protein MKX03_036271 [Papaver bracteatum]|nr:hypothetical protein MKX03_036271 [Papaver bracteatum]